MHFDKYLNFCNYSVKVYLFTQLTALKFNHATNTINYYICYNQKHKIGPYVVLLASVTNPVNFSKIANYNALD